jgi:hypothetical protein
MKAIVVLAMIAAAGTPLVIVSQATPADRIAMADVGQRVDSVINARKREVDPRINQKCFGAQTRDRYGYCVLSFRRGAAPTRDVPGSAGVRAGAGTSTTKTRQHRPPGVSQGPRPKAISAQGRQISLAE